MMRTISVSFLVSSTAAFVIGLLLNGSQPTTVERALMVSGVAALISIAAWFHIGEHK